MSKVIVSLECGCFKKSGIANNQSFENKELALEEAQNIKANINETFCQKHAFDIKEDGENILIEVTRNS